MIYINDLPYLKTTLNKKVSLPRDSKSINKFNMVYLNSNTVKSVYNIYANTSIFNTPTNYSIYYIPPIYKDKIGTKTININYRQDRKSIYADVTASTTGLTPINALNLANDRNCFYDLAKYNELFISNYRSRSNVKVRVKNYFDFISSKINLSEVSTYKYKMMLIDINTWFNTSTKANPSDITKVINPVTFIVYSLYKYPEALASLGDIDIYLFSEDGILRFNPSKIDKDTYKTFVREINKLLKKVPNNNLSTIESVDDEEDIDTDDLDEEPVKPNTGNTTVELPRAEDAKAAFSDTAIDDGIEELRQVADQIQDEPSKSLDLIEPEDEDDDIPDATETTDEEFGEILNTMVEVRHARKNPRSEASIKRDKELKQIQSKLTIDDKTIEELTVITEEDKTIPVDDISNKVKTTNDNLKSVKYANFDKSYNEQLMRKDTINILTSLNDKSIPVFVKSIKVEDTSTELTYKETYTVVLEDSNRVRHTLKFDMPKFIDNTFMYIEGNKEIINKQLFMKPIVKTGPDEVQICSNYNKIFLSRIGRKMTSQLEKFKKTIASDIKGVKVTYGDNMVANSTHKTVLEYDELAKTLFSIKTSKIEIIFSQNEVKYRAAMKSIDYPNDHMCIGFYSDGKPILMDYETETIDGMDLIPFIMSNLGKDAQDIYDESSAGATKFMYTSAKIMAKPVPVILLLGYCEGITTVLKKAKINHHFTDKRPSADDKHGVIQFADGYLIFDRYPFENSLLLNALSYIPTRAYNYSDFDDIDVYLDLFDQLYGARNLANAFDTFYDFMIDPITKEVLQDLGYPTDFVSVVLCANAMLADNTYIAENNMNLYRVRSNEIVNALLYKEIAMAYSRYRATSENKNPVKISIRQNAVLSALQATQTVENYSTLNPLFEATKTRIASPKGVSGMNLEQSYTLDKRGYDKTMVGLAGVSTAVDANVGISRHLTLEPNIVSARGYIDISDDYNKLSDANLFTPAEMLTPMGITRDDAPRVSMASKQSTHIVPIDKASPVLISNGSEQTIQYYLSSDFTVVADEDGEVVEIDSATGLMVVKYKSGQHRAIDLNSKVAKNAASGFYVVNKLKTDYKVGNKFKAKDILAYEERFFSNDEINGNRMNIGTLQKVAIMSAYSTYEDSSFVTKKISNDMATSVVMMKDISIGKNADVDHIVKIGDTISVGDPLVSFSTSYDDAKLNDFLRNISDEQADDIKSFGKTILKAKYGGVIEDIKIYCTVELEDLSPSLKSIVSAYYNKINKKKKLLNKYDKTDSVVKAGVMVNEPTSKIEPSSFGKIKGHDVDGVLIEFYIRYNDIVGVGDKITRILVI